MSAGVWHGANLALAFLLELAALVALADWGVATGESTASKIVLGVGAPLAAAVLWGLFAAPRAVFRHPILRPAVKALVFGAAVLSLFATDHDLLAIVLGIVVVINIALLSSGAPNQVERRS